MRLSVRSVFRGPLILLALLTLALGAAQGVAASAPSPSFGATCVGGGSTTGSWKHVHVDDVSFQWGWPPLTQYKTGADLPANPKAPAGRVSIATPTAPNDGNPVTVTVVFSLGGVEQGETTAACT